MRSTCPCIEDDYIPARYTRYAKQRNFDMDPRYEALLDVSFLLPNMLSSLHLRVDIWSSHFSACKPHHQHA